MRVAPRFFIFITVLLVAAAYVIFTVWPGRVKTVQVVAASYNDSRTVQGIVVRDETLYSVEGYGRITYIAPEGVVVNQGDEVAHVYASDYVERHIANLESVRQQIRNYHNTLLTTIIDRDLERLDNAVDQRAQQIKQVVNGKAQGSLTALEEQLAKSMQERLEYIRENKRENPKGNQLYDEEAQLMNHINTWRVTETAKMSGIASFYFDGWENTVNASRISELDIATLREVMRSPKNPQLSVGRGQQPLYRIVNPASWNLVLISSARNWSPIPGDVYHLQPEGYDDVLYTGTVLSQQTADNGQVVAVLRLQDPIGPLLNVRSLDIQLGYMMQGFQVPAGALRNEGGQDGVRRADVQGGTFVPVNVLSRSGGTVLVQPVDEGALVHGTTVLVD